MKKTSTEGKTGCISIKPKSGESTTWGVNGDTKESLNSPGTFFKQKHEGRFIP